MSRTFKHLGEDWEVQPTGLGHGVGAGYLPAITSWGMVFRCLSNPTKGPYYASLHNPDPTRVPEGDLRKALDKALILKALEDPRWKWRTVDGVAQDTGLPEQQILQFIESSPDEVIRARLPDHQGMALYATRRHYTKNRGFLDRFRDP